MYIVSSFQYFQYYYEIYTLDVDTKVVLVHYQIIQNVYFRASINFEIYMLTYLMPCVTTVILVQHW